MIFALAKLSAVIPGFNVRPQTEDDFFRLAEAEGVRVVFDDLPILQGFTARCIEDDRVRDYIFLDYRLRGTELVYIAFHELAHFFLHVPRARRAAAHFYSLARPSMEEAEADAGALVCVYPKSEIETLEYRYLHADAFERKLMIKRLALKKQFGE